MKWIPWIAVGIYVISMLLVLFLGNRVKGTSQDKKNTEKNPIVIFNRIVKNEDILIPIHGPIHHVIGRIKAAQNVAPPVPKLNSAIFIGRREQRDR